MFDLGEPWMALGAGLGIGTIAGGMTGLRTGGPIAAVLAAGACALIGLFSCAATTIAAPAAGNRPNIVLMMADDQAWGETGYNGHPYVKTPVLDEMARTSLRLDRFYAGSPVCSPTRASVMTGRHATRSGACAPLTTRNVGRSR